MPILTPARRSVWSVRFVVGAITAACIALPVHQVSAQPASFAGTVLTDSTERPLVDAVISIPDISRAVRSDSAGNFLVSDIKPGRHLVTLRRVGYVPIDTWFEFRDSQKVEADLLMRPLTPKLSTVLVKETGSRARTVREQEFEEHRHGPGKILLPELFAAQYNRPLGFILQGRIAGIHTEKIGGTGEALASRGGCLVQVVVNGMTMYRPPMTRFDLNTINSIDIIGLVFYTYPETPERYKGQGATCGTVVMWTKV